MKRIPHAREVDQAFRSARATVKKALKGLNQIAGQAMAKGDYASAEALATRGREIQQFESDIEALRTRWRELRGGGGGGTKKVVTPLWAYYQPILKALAERGGEARRTDLEPGVVRMMSGTLLAGDLETMARGRERWKVMIQRARKHLVAEGWLEDKPGPTWSITAAGRRAAEKSSLRGASGT